MGLLDDPTYRPLKRDPTTKIEKRVSQALNQQRRVDGYQTNLDAASPLSFPLLHGSTDYQKSIRRENRLCHPSDLQRTN